MCAYTYFTSSLQSNMYIWYVERVKNKLTSNAYTGCGTEVNFPKQKITNKKINAQKADAKN